MFLQCCFVVDIVTHVKGVVLVNKFYSLAGGVVGDIVRLVKGDMVA